MVLQCFGNLYENGSLIALHAARCQRSLFFCISCSRCWVNKCGLCDLFSSPPRCLNDSEAPLHVCVCVCQYNDGRGEGKFIFVLLLPLLRFQLPKFQKVPRRRLLCSSWDCAALVFPMADWLQLSSQSKRASPERQCRGDPAPGSLYASVDRTEEISFTQRALYHR